MTLFSKCSDFSAVLMFQSVRVAAIATVSQLLNASTPDAGEENNTTLG